MQTLTQQLTTLIKTKPIQKADWNMAARLTLDALACAVAGRDTPPGRIVQRWLHDTAEVGCHAFALGAWTHILELDDLHRDSVVHPGCVVIPAAWAVGRRDGLSGRRVLTAILHGFEAVTRIGRAVGPAHYRFWHNTATVGPFGAAMAVATLLNLDDAATVHALGNAGSQAAGLWEFLETGAMTKHLHAGRAAESGVRAAELAQLGFTGPPAILEGRRGFFAAACPDARPEAVLAEPDAPWQVWQTSIKPWPSCRHTHPALDAALALSSRVVPDAIERIIVETYPAALALCDRPHPQTPYEAQFSLQHAVAAALTGSVDFKAFQTDAIAKLAAWRAKVTVQVADEYAKAYPNAWGGCVTVYPRDGQVLQEARRHAKGDPEAPLTDAELQAKAAALLQAGGVKEPDRLVTAILALVEDGSLPPLDYLGPL